MRNPAWNDSEQNAVVALYVAMLLHVQNGEKYSKAAMIRATQNNHSGPIDSGLNTAPLKLRSKGSIESKLMNVTACIEKLGRPDLSMSEHGYRPLSNCQKSLYQAVEMAARSWPQDVAA